MNSNFIKSSCWYSVIFWAGMVLVAVCHLVSIERIPLPWLDEVHIVEMGRNILDSGHRDYSLWIAKDGSFLQPIYYLGPILQEFAYRTCGRLGPRLSVLLALLISTILCRIWLNRQQLSKGLVTMLSLIFLTYPLLIQSVKIVRVDAWTFIPLFLCLLLFGRLSGDGRRNIFIFFMIGFFASGAFFIWPTVTLFYPLLLLEMLRARERHSYSVVQTLKYVAIGIVGGLVAVLFLVLPFLNIIGLLFQSIGAYFDLWQSNQSMSVSLLFKMKGLALLLIKESLRAPFVMILVVFGFWDQRKDWQLLACFLMAFCMAFFSELHPFRFVYLLPFSFLLLVAGSRALYQRYPRFAAVFMTCTVLYGLLSGGVAYAGITPALKGRSYTAFRDELRKVVGEGPKQVYLHNLQAYYVARELQWHYFRYGPTCLDKDSQCARLLDQSDYVVEMKKPSFYAVEESFTLYGAVRDYVIRAAIKESTASCPSTAAKIGYALASRSPSLQEQEQFNQLLLSSGFQQYRGSDLSRKNQEYAAWQLTVRSWMAVPPDYDVPIIWGRIKKRN
jgi:hypothetical protein